MTFPANSALPRLQKVPHSRTRTWWLWPQPVAPGLYGNSWSSQLWITSNHLPAVVAVGQADRLVLAVEAGGLHPSLAAAFDPHLVEDARSQIEKLTTSTHMSMIQVDPALAKRLLVQPGSQAGGKAFEVISARAADRSQIGWRLIGAFLLTLGQALIAAIPLLLFGWYNLATGLGVLMGAGFLLSLLWPLSRRKCLPCRLVLSTLSTLIAVGIAWLGFGMGPERLAWLAGGWGLASFWLSFVFLGAKH